MGRKRIRHYKSKEQRYDSFLGVCNHMGLGKLFKIWDLFYFKDYHTLQQYHLVG